MKQYKDFRPTAMDPKGLGLGDKQDWLVCPVGVTRDTPDYAIDRINFDCLENILDKVDPEGNDHENHSFGHWGPGWFEIILVRPDSECAHEAEAAEEALHDYPVLDDEALSAAEYEAAEEDWFNMNIKERMITLQQNGLSGLAARRDEIPDGLRAKCLGDGVYWYAE